MIPKSSGIYVIKNTTNNKIYVGSAKNLNRRWINQHRPYLRSKKHPNPHLQSAYDLYGEENFIFEILELVDFENLLIREQYWLDLTQSYDRGLGYNISINAVSGFGRKLSDETKRKISNARKGTKLSEETKTKISRALTGENNPFFGKKHSEETKKKISIKNTGNKNSEYQKLRAKEANIGKVISNAHKESIKKSNSTRIISDESKQKMKDKKIGRKLSEETRQKMRESRQKYLESKTK